MALSPADPLLLAPFVGNASCWEQYVVLDIRAYNRPSLALYNVCITLTVSKTTSTGRGFSCQVIMKTYRALSGYKDEQQYFDNLNCIRCPQPKDLRLLFAASIPDAKFYWPSRPGGAPVRESERAVLYIGDICFLQNWQAEISSTIDHR